jgi:hypothetical protein
MAKLICVVPDFINVAQKGALFMQMGCFFEVGSPGVVPTGKNEKI